MTLYPYGYPTARFVMVLQEAAMSMYRRPPLLAYKLGILNASFVILKMGSEVPMRRTLPGGKWQKPSRTSARQSLTG